MIVTLSTEEMVRAAAIGVKRRVSSLDRCQDRLLSTSRGAWDIDIEGACGELAAALALGLEWRGDVDTYKKPDLDHNIQVRTTQGNPARLRMSPRDSPNERFVLVVGVHPRYEVVGWIDGNQFREKKYWHAERKVWYIPYELLNSLSELLKVINEEKTNVSV